MLFQDDGKWSTKESLTYKEKWCAKYMIHMKKLTKHICKTVIIIYTL